MARRLPGPGRGVTGQGGIAGFKGNVGVEGLSEVQKALKQLPDKLQERAVKNAMAAGARVIRNEARRLVPVGYGDPHLRDMIVVSRTVQERGKRKSVKGGVVLGIKDSGRYYAHLIEFGKHNAAPQPFMRPAFDNKQAEALKVIGPKLGKEIEKQARKLGKMSGAQRRKAFSR